MKLFKLSFVVCMIWNSINVLAIQDTKVPMYIVTAANSPNRYFLPLLNLIGSLHVTNFDSIEEIAIFDLGLTAEQRKLLNTIEKVKLYDIELIHPEILKPLPYSPGSQRVMPGLQSWKPVAIKQALDMFPYIFYLDAGTTVLKPLDDLFKFIIQEGYFFIDCGQNIEWMTTKFLINKFDLLAPEKKGILKSAGISSGQQGITRNIYQSYVTPMYELAKNINNFVDDGTAGGGPGCGRHDQTLFSILVQLNHYTIHNRAQNMITVGNKKVPMNITPNVNAINKDTIFVQSRKNMPNLEYYKGCIRYKKALLIKRKNNV